MKLFILMIQLMTRIPLPIMVKVDEKKLGKGNIFFPVIGAVIGLIMAGVSWVLARFFGLGQLYAILVMLTYLWASGGLHIDGLSDTFDGLWSNRPRDRMLEIMRDSRVGVYGVLILILTIIIWIVGLTELGGGWQYLILIPMLGRYGAVVANSISNYAREEGMGKYFVQFCGGRELLLTSLYTWPVTYWLIGLKGIWILLTVIIFTYLLVRWVKKKIGGITGDIIGATIELNQLLIIFILTYFMV